MTSHLLGVDDDLLTTLVDTTTSLQGPRISFCEQWLTTCDERFDDLSKRPIQLDVVERNQSAIVLEYLIWGATAALMFAISGISAGDDQTAVQTFRERFQSEGWVSEHAAFVVQVPGMYLLADPAQDSLSDDTEAGLMQLAQHVTAAFFRQIGLPV